jgi:hypothetical protein
MRNDSNIPNPRAAASQQAIAELQAIRRELGGMRQLFDRFFAVYLNARFPHGKPTDRWGKRRG